MAKKKKEMAKKKKEIKVAVHVPPDFKEPDHDVVIVPVPLEKDAGPLKVAVEKVRCVLTICEPFWGGQPYVILAAAPGEKLSESLKTGQLVDVQFLPPE